MEPFRVRHSLRWSLHSDKIKGFFGKVNSHDAPTTIQYVDW